MDGRFEIGKEIGKGAFSVVHRCKRLEDGKILAVKVIDKAKIKKPQDLQYEIDILKELKHEHILGLIEAVNTEKKCYLVTDLLGGGELFDHIIEQGSYTEKDAAGILTQILDALSYLHTNSVVHRDLKPENLLCASRENPTQRIVISDFGLARKLNPDEKLSNACGTPGYVSPEILLHEPYAYEVDIWALGVIAYILLVGYPPFYSEDDNDQEVLQMTMEGKYDFDEDWEDVSESAKQFIRGMLEMDTKKRWSARQCLEHSWVQGHTAANVNIAERVSSKMKAHFAKRNWKKLFNAQRAIQRFRMDFGSKNES
ncbi:CAMK/CAMK1 protein kinase [Salpingoeca rosetta]|uniref:CAMK/CAMK1 protein kinase n=1 Tax=Salpingoeca rosetta (strain ATCC 50818 / BSB-021) TaxID=946362 RepID=F2UML5_SALR5|nr:CAMK/CAMK1 protein kinase [Salpingoeca rosetta]EGD78364.1 CAMK/CAMK1 protein kinase [Salpingoeca rosetta]|eukprot:XP_004989687.1 CAMK/CAMK1 protein kinase [Salpingoeca rosetta]